MSLKRKERKKKTKQKEVETDGKRNHTELKCLNFGNRMFEIRCGEF